MHTGGAIVTPRCPAFLNVSFASGSGYPMGTLNGAGEGKAWLLIMAVPAFAKPMEHADVYAYEMAQQLSVAATPTAPTTAPTIVRYVLGSG